MGEESKWEEVLQGEGQGGVMGWGMGRGRVTGWGLGGDGVSGQVHVTGAGSCGLGRGHVARWDEGWAGVGSQGGGWLGSSVGGHRVGGGMGRVP